MPPVLVSSHPKHHQNGAFSKRRKEKSAKSWCQEHKARGMCLSPFRWPGAPWCAGLVLLLYGCVITCVLQAVLEFSAQSRSKIFYKTASRAMAFGQQNFLPNFSFPDLWYATFATPFIGTRVLQAVLQFSDQSRSKNLLSDKLAVLWHPWQQIFPSIFFFLDLWYAICVIPFIGTKKDKQPQRQVSLCLIWPGQIHCIFNNDNKLVDVWFKFSGFIIFSPSAMTTTTTTTTTAMAKQRQQQQQ